MASTRHWKSVSLPAAFATGRLTNRSPLVRRALVPTLRIVLAVERITFPFLFRVQEPVDPLDWDVLQI